MAQYTGVNIRIGADVTGFKNGLKDAVKGIKVDFDALKNSNKSVNVEFDRLIKNASNSKKNIGELRKEIKEVSNISFKGLSTKEIEKVQARLKELRTQLKELNGTSVKPKVELPKQTNVGGGLGNIKGAVIGGMAALGVADVTGDVIRLTSEYQKYQAVLTNSLGSQQLVNDKMAMLKDYAATTPFQLTELTAAYVKLCNQGFVPTKAQMVLMGDLASSTGKSFDQLAEAVLDAQTGEFERLKEFGIKAKKSGDDVTFSFKGVETTVKNNASAIQGYILGLGKLQGVMGSNAAISATLGGKISNLKDQWDGMLTSIGQGNNGVLTGAVSMLSKMIDNIGSIGVAVGVAGAAYGAFSIAIGVNNALLAANAAGQASTGIVALGKAIMTATGLQRIFNVTALANPYVWIAGVVAAVGALVAGLILARKETLALLGIKTKKESSSTDESTRFVKQKMSLWTGADSGLEGYHKADYYNKDKGDAAEKLAYWRKMYSEGKATGFKNNDEQEILQEIKNYKSLIATMEQYKVVGTDVVKLTEKITKTGSSSSTSKDKKDKVHKDTPLESYNKEEVAIKKNYEIASISEDDYNKKRLENLNKYLVELAKVGKKDDKKEQEYKDLSLKVWFDDSNKEAYKELNNIQEELQKQADAQPIKVPTFVENVENELKNRKSKKNADKVQIAADYKEYRKKGGKALAGGDTGEVNGQLLDYYIQQQDELQTLIALKDTYTATDGINGLASAMQSLASVTSGGASAWISYGSNALNALASLIPVLQKMFLLNQAVSFSEAVSGAMKMPWPLSIVALGLNIAAVVAAFASIPKFASGGIVPGSSYAGDTTMIAANAGERILTTGQQGTLDRVLSSGNASSSSGGGEVVFRIEGTTLVGILNKQNKFKNSYL